MAISYEEALATLQSMFTPQGYNSQQLDAVLRHHGGHMENTVETLLNHGEGSPDELMNKLQSIPAGNNSNNSTANSNSNADTLPGEVHQHNIDADEELARQLAAEDERAGRSGSSRLSTQNNRGSPTRSNLGLGLASAMGRNRLSPGERRPMASNITSPSRQQQPTRQQPATQQPPVGTKGIGISTQLPSDFLRIPGRTYNDEGRSSNNTSSDPITSASLPGDIGGQMMSDEQLARMLQDELFQEELRNNPEFSHLAGRRNPRSITTGGGGRQTTGRSTYSGAQGGSGANDFFEDLGDNLSKLGDVAKRRFQDFAANWNGNDPNRQSNQSSRQLFGGGGGGRSQSNVNTGNERRGLLADDLNMEDEGEELDFIGNGGNSSSNNFVEMNDVGDKKKD